MLGAATGRDAVPPPPPPPLVAGAGARGRTVRRPAAVGGGVGRLGALLVLGLLSGGGLGARLGGGGLGLHPQVRLTRPAFLLLLDEVAQLALGGCAGALVFLGLRLGSGLGGGDLLLLLLGRIALVLQGLLFVGELTDCTRQVVGVGRPGVQRDTCELLALHVLVERHGVADQRAEGIVARPPHEGLHGDLTELALQAVDLGLLGGDGRLGVVDLGLEAVELVDGDRVVLGEGVGLLLEGLELIRDLGDPRLVGRRSGRRGPGHRTSRGSSAWRRRPLRRSSRGSGART